MESLWMFLLCWAAILVEGAVGILQPDSLYMNKSGNSLYGIVAFSWTNSSHSDVLFLCYNEKATDGIGERICDGLNYKKSEWMGPIASSDLPNKDYRAVEGIVCDDSDKTVGDCYWDTVPQSECEEMATIKCWNKKGGGVSAGMWAWIPGVVTPMIVIFCMRHNKRANHTHSCNCLCCSCCCCCKSRTSSCEQQGNHHEDTVIHVEKNGVASTDTGAVVNPNFQNTYSDMSAYNGPQSSQQPSGASVNPADPATEPPPPSYSALYSEQQPVVA